MHKFNTAFCTVSMVFLVSLSACSGGKCDSIGLCASIMAIPNMAVSMGTGIGSKVGTMVGLIGPNSGTELHVHGNWCGPGVPAPGTTPPPIDSLDRICKTHDRCYLNKGYLDCSCDQELMNGIVRGREYYKLSEVEKKILNYFQSSTCRGGCKSLRITTIYGQDTSQVCDSR